MNIIVADSKEIAEEVTEKICIESTEENSASLGFKFDGVNFIKPEIVPPAIEG
jgi:hypothetical protein